ncbi:MAG: thiolase family protein [Deltaproteobacteria bacterium]|nr:thiolase family protein [Deltaproteobacteria bacterium]
MSCEVYVAGAGLSAFKKSTLSIEELMAEAGKKALEFARHHPIDSIYIGAMNVEEFVGEANFATLLAEYLGLSGIGSSRVETACSTGAAVFESAFYAVASGYMKTVLVVAGEKMSHAPKMRRARILREVIDREERRYGATMPALAAMITRRYQKESGLSDKSLQRVLSRVVEKNSANGILNPYARAKRRITEDIYEKSRFISTPLRLYDCSPNADGAAAVVLTCEKTPIRVSGIGHATDTLALRHRASLTSFSSTRASALKAYAMAQLNPGDIQFAEVHDAFSIFEIIGTEDLGFFEPGRGWRAVEDGVTALDGGLPVNPSGGLLARGHPAGASGLAQIVEIVLMMLGEVDEKRQVKRTEVGLAQSAGALANNNVVTILEKSDRHRVITTGWQPEYKPVIQVGTVDGPPQPLAASGILETYTALYATPEGFSAPHTLGIIGIGGGKRVLARYPKYLERARFKIGQKVVVKKRGDSILFETRSLLHTLKDGVRGLFKRKAGASRSRAEA